MQEHIHFIFTGGTIDSVFDIKKDMVVVNDHSSIPEYIGKYVQSNCSMSHEILTFKDSRDISDNIRAELLSSVQKCPHKNIIITHGTYTMSTTLNYLHDNLSDHDKTVVLTGALLPLSGFSPSDAPFNLGFAVAGAILLPAGFYLAMNAQFFRSHEVEKDTSAAKFVNVSQNNK